MSKLVFIFLVLSTLFSQETEISKFFKYVMDIEFSQDILIGEISSLDVKDNNLLITDMIGSKVYLFDINGKLITELNAEDCIPGFHWRPMFAKYYEDGILVINSSPWGYRFSTDGDCKGSMDDEFIAPLDLCFLNNKKIVGYYNELDPYLAILTSSGETETKFGKFDNEFKNFRHRFEGGGLISDENDNIYQLESYTWKIKKYDKTGKFIGTIGTKPSFFRQIERDLDSNPVRVIRDFRKIVDGKTLVNSIFLLSKNIILIQYESSSSNNSMTFYLQIISNTGKDLIQELIRVSSPVLFAKDNYIYLSEQPSMTNGILPNPKLKVYKINDGKLK